MVLGKPDIHMQKNEIEPLYYTVHKLKMNQKLRYKTWSVKLEENTVGKLHDLGLGNDFMNITPKAQTKKCKNRQVGLYQIKMLLHSKGNNPQNKKTTYRMRENIHKSYFR